MQLLTLILWFPMLFLDAFSYGIKRRPILTMAVTFGLTWLLLEAIQLLKK